jgi:hypothetical protein
MEDSYGPFYAAFLKDHPGAVAGVQMVGGEMYMNTETMRRFIAWSLASGLVTHEEQALALLERLPAWDAQVRTAAKRHQHTQGARGTRAGV